MPIHNEQTDHAHFCTGPSLTEPEHAERCSIPYQLQRVSRGLQPNWGGNEIQFGYEKMDNSLTDHKIALEKAAKEALASDLTELSDEQFDQLSPTAKAVLFNEREKQKKAKDTKKQNDEKNQKQNDERKLRDLQNAVKELQKASKTSAGSTLTDEKPAAASTNTNGRNPNNET